MTISVVPVFDLLDVFADGEDAVFNAVFTNADGTDLASPSEARWVVCSDEAKTTPVFTASLASSEITQVSGATHQVKPTSENRDLLTAGTVYFYDLWTNDATNGWRRQAEGTFRLDRASRGS